MAINDDNSKWIRPRIWLYERGLRWSTISNLMKTRISQTAAFIPFIGYALLWSENFREQLELHTALGGGIWFNTTERLLLIYAGAILLASSWFLYAVFCPKIIKEMPSMDDYVFRKRQVVTPLQVNDLCDHTEKKIVLPGDGTTAKPTWVKSSQNISLLHMSPERVLNAINVSRSYARKHDNTIANANLSVLLHSDYHSQENSWFFALILSFILFLFGAIILLIPSVEVFLAVMLKILFPVVGL